MDGVPSLPPVPCGIATAWCIRAAWPCISARAGRGFAAFIDSARPIREVDRELLEVFCTNIAPVRQNVDLVARAAPGCLRRPPDGPAQPHRAGLCAQCPPARRRPAGALAIVDVDQFASPTTCSATTTATPCCARPPSAWPAGCRARSSWPGWRATPGGARGRRSSMAPNIQACLARTFVIEEVRHPVSVCGRRAADGAHPLGHRISQGQLPGPQAGQGPGAGARRWCIPASWGLEPGSGRSCCATCGWPSTRRGCSRLSAQVDLPPGGWSASRRCCAGCATTAPRSPGCFIPIAEQSGLIVGMGNWLLQIALLALQRFRAQASRSCGWPSMCRRSSCARNFLARVQEALAETGVAADGLELGSPSRSRSAASSRRWSTCGNLRAMGSRWPSTISAPATRRCLPRAPAGRPPEDRPQLHALPLRATAGGRIARTIIVLGRELGLTVLAEGSRTRPSPPRWRPSAAPRPRASTTPGRCGEACGLAAGPGTRLMKAAVCSSPCRAVAWRPAGAGAAADRFHRRTHRPLG